MAIVNLAVLGWGPIQEQQLLTLAGQNIRPVRVLGVHRSVVHVVAPGIDATLSMPLKLDKGPVTVGDWLIVDETGQRIIDLLDRSSLFRRRAPGTDRREQLIAANVDTLFIVSSCNQDFNEARLERYLAIGRDAGVMSLIVLTKADLCDDSSDFARRAVRLAPGLIVETVNALEPHSLTCLDAWLGSGQTIALLGSSGVGKSTLSNTLRGVSDIATQEARADDDRGRHTTTARQLHQLPGGAWLMDTPGMRELQLTDVQAGLDDVFAEISGLAAKCRFADCTHDAEPGCAVRAAVKNGEVDASRVKRWHKLVREEARNRESIAERRARDKSTGRLYKTIISDSHRKKGRGP